MAASVDAAKSLVVNGATIEISERGKGRDILFLHPGTGIETAGPALDALARGGRVIAPSHPGFGTSQLPKAMSTVDDLAYFYLDMIEQIDLRDALVVGIGLGGWIAAEMAIKDSSRFSHLVMVNAIGVKVGDRETRDIVDIWALLFDEYNALAYADPNVGKRDFKTLPAAESLAAARNREAYARFCWSPYMHNPKLKGRLHRVRVPTLFLWGTADRILSEQYGRGYCSFIPGAKFETIERAGHLPHEEQPEELARRALAFAESNSLAATARARRA